VTYEHLALPVLAQIDKHPDALHKLVVHYPEPTLIARHPMVMFRASPEQTDAAQRWPDKIAVADAPADRGLTFAELDERANRAAAGLRGLGITPGDRILLHSDGVVEARDETGEEFGVERLVELAEHAAAAQLPAPETLRRLAHAVREHRRGELRDDATLMLVEWSGSAAERLLARLAENGRER